MATRKLMPQGFGKLTAKRLQEAADALEVLCRDIPEPPVGKDPDEALFWAKLHLRLVKLRGDLLALEWKLEGKGQARSRKA